MSTNLTTSRVVSTRSRLPMLLMLPLVAQLPFRAVAQGDGGATPDSATPEPPSWDEAELEAAGMTGPTSYQSPQFGYTVVWTDAWELDFDRPVGLPVGSWPEADRDALYLVRSGFDDTLTMNRLSFVSVHGDGRSISQRFVEATEDREVVTSFVMPDAVTWVELATPDDPAQIPVVTVNQLRALDDGAALVIWLVASQEDIAAASRDASDVLLDGAPVFDGFTVGEIGNALA